MIVGVDAKRIVRNGTGLGSYGRTLVNDLLRLGDSEMELRLYAPDEGKDALRGQIIEGATFCYLTVLPSGTAGAQGPREVRLTRTICWKDTSRPS